MRPLPGDDAYTGRSRSTSINDNDLTPLATRTQPPQMSYFLADERTLESGEAQPIRVPLKPRDSLKNSSYGVESLETTISSLSEGSGDEDAKFDRAREKFKKNLAEKLQSVGDSRSRSPKPSYDISGTTSPTRPSTTEASRSYTPMSSYSAAPGSIISSPGSRASDIESFNDDIASQAIVSGEEDEQDVPAMMDSGSAPQLVMPSIKMPSRRPFTEKGKNMGRLKVLIAGDSGKYILLYRKPLC